MRNTSAQSPECACTEILIREVATGAVVAGPLAANATSVDIPCALLQSAGSLCVICIGPDGGAAMDLSDAVTILSCLFGGLLCPTCLDAADCNDDGTIDLSDAVCVLDCVFATGPCPDPPFPGCTIDQTTDNLGCGLYTSC